MLNKIPSIAVVFGFSEQGIDLSKRMMISFCNNILERSSKEYIVDFHPYRCNFEITKFREFNKGLRFLESPPPPDSYQFSEFIDDIKWNLPEWNGNIIEHDCSNNNFQPFYFPDVAVYHDFATHFNAKYDYILYCHNDMEFRNDPTGNLDFWTETVELDSEYSIITELRSTANHNISLRFHMCFVFVSCEKFHESSLSFINELKFIDPSVFHVYSNGGGGLLASFFKRQSSKPAQETMWRPYVINTHGVYRGKEITTEDKWFVHTGEIEWNRSRPLSEGASINKTNQEYQRAKEYVQSYMRHYDIPNQ